ncbi:MAG: hypothetical protein ACJAYB_000036 [Psychromonas sp.]
MNGITASTSSQNKTERGFIMKITQQQLVDLGACKPGFDRFIEQTGNTDQPVKILNLIGGKNTTDDLLWFAGETLPKMKIVIFAVECAESVLHLHTDPRVLAAIQAARDWIKEPSEVHRLNARDAADNAGDNAPSAAAYAAAYTSSNVVIYASNAARHANAAPNEAVKTSLIQLFSE